MKLKQSDKKILLIAAGVIILIGTYFFIFSGLNTKRAEIEMQNGTLQQEVNYLQDLKDHEQEYNDEMVRMAAENEDIISQFPADVRPETVIMYGQGLEVSNAFAVSSLEMPAASLVEVPVLAATDSTAAAPAAAEPAAAPAPAAGSAPTSSSLMLYNAPVTMGFRATYGGIKDVIKVINSDTNRKSISSVTMAFDASTGNLMGSITANMYFVKGTDKVYEAPAVPGVGVGTNNIFKAAESLNATRDTVAAEGAATEDTEGDSTEAEE